MQVETVENLMNRHVYTHLRKKLLPLPIPKQGKPNYFTPKQQIKRQIIFQVYLF